MKNFTFPTTANCTVIWVRKGVRYSSVIPTPKTVMELLQGLAFRQVGTSEILRIEPAYTFSR